MNLSFNYINFSFITIFISFIFIILLFNYYNFLKKNKNRFICKILFLLRFTILAILFIFILNPIFSYVSSLTQSNDLNLFLDISKSMELNIKNNDIDIDSLVERIEIEGKNRNLNINYYTFGSDVNNLDSFDNIAFNDTITNFSIFYDYLKNFNKNDNIVLISDGLNNFGKYNFKVVEDNKIFTLGIGNKFELVNDIEIQNITYKASFLVP